MKRKVYSALAAFMMVGAIVGTCPNVQAQEAITEATTEEAQKVPQGYLIPDSAERYLTEEDLADMDLQIVAYAKNEIYARYGWKFNSKELRNYFNSQDWYEGHYTPEEFPFEILSQYEVANAQLLYDQECKLAEEGYELDKNSDYTKIYEYLEKVNHETLEPESEEATN